MIADGACPPASTGTRAWDTGASPRGGGLHLHPWRLYAVNVEDPGRRQGLRIGADPADRRWLASFMGAHMPHYLDDSRLRLQALAGEPDCRIELTGDRWHFDGIVYGHQVRNEPLDAHAGGANEVDRYNALLGDSVFALCPCGAGPNTLRLWEALAAGSVPVLIGHEPVLPRGGSLEPIDWDRIVLRHDLHRVAELPARLRGISTDERRERQRLGMAAFERVRRQTCFARMGNT